MDNRNDHRQTPLHTTAEKGSTEVVRLYIKMGADIMARDNNGRTPLHCAAEKRENEEVIRLLVESGADINVCDGEERAV